MDMSNGCLRTGFSRVNDWPSGRWHVYGEPELPERWNGFMQRKHHLRGTKQQRQVHEDRKLRDRVHYNIDDHGSLWWWRRG